MESDYKNIVEEESPWVSRRKPVYNDSDENKQTNRRRIVSEDSGQEMIGICSGSGYNNSNEIKPVNKRRRMEEFDQDVYYPRRGRESDIHIRSGADILEVNSEGIYLGRSEENCEFLRLNSLVSRHHAFIYKEKNGCLQIRDEKSLNGTFVDQGEGRKRIYPQEIVSLSVGNKFWLANQLFVVEYR